MNSRLITLIIPLLFPISDQIQCNNFWQYQAGGRITKSDRTVVNCPNFCMSIDAEGDVVSWYNGSCPDPSDRFHTCDVVECRKDRQAEWHVVTCCCTTDFCNTAPATLSNAFLGLLFIYLSNKVVFN